MDGQVLMSIYKFDLFYEEQNWPKLQDLRLQNANILKRYNNPRCSSVCVLSFGQSHLRYPSWHRSTPSISHAWACCSLSGANCCCSPSVDWAFRRSSVAAPWPDPRAAARSARKRVQGISHWIAARTKGVPLHSQGSSAWICRPGQAWRWPPGLIARSTHAGSGSPGRPACLEREQTVRQGLRSSGIADGN